MNCLIVDDEEMSRKNLVHLCSKIIGIDVVAVCENGIQAIAALEKNDIDLLFLDIEMPDLTGIEMVKSLDNLPQVIFTTSQTEYALEAFEHDVTDYIVKPITLARLLKAINKAKKMHEKSTQINLECELYIRTNGKLVKLKYEEISFIETMDDYLIINTDESVKHIIHSTLSKMNDKLKGRTFLKVHRSYIINLEKINSIEDTHVMIQKKIIPVSKAHRKLLMEKVNLL